jgi:hypothetical protein
LGSGFESGSLHRRVLCELDFLAFDRGTLVRPAISVRSQSLSRQRCLPPHRTPSTTPPLLGFLELDLDNQSGPETHALGVLFGFVRNQGDGWTQALDYLTRYLGDALVSTGARPSHLPDPDVFFLALARQLGLRTAKMHRALAEQGRDDPDFAPEPISAEEVAQWRRELGFDGVGLPGRRSRPQRAARDHLSFSNRAAWWVMFSSP